MAATSGKPNDSSGTKRLRFVFRLFAKALRHPLLLLKSLKPRYISALFKKLRSGDVGRAEELVGYTLSASAPLKKRLTLINANTTNTKPCTITGLGGSWNGR